MQMDILACIVYYYFLIENNNNISVYTFDSVYASHWTLQKQSAFRPEQEEE